MPSEICERWRVRRILFPLVLASAGLAFARPCDGASGGFEDTGSLAHARQNHTATLLPDGKVLVAGGFDHISGYLASAELYDPGSGTWMATGSLVTARFGHTATLLPNGKVLVVGGTLNFSQVPSAELYDPGTGTWTETGSPARARQGHTATLLGNGKVLVAGGAFYIFGGGIDLIALAELYDPATGVWTSTGSLGITREYATASLLLNGKVLILGGSSVAELYDPDSGLWTATGSLATAGGHTATLLPNGKVLAVGGGGLVAESVRSRQWDLDRDWQPRQPRRGYGNVAAQRQCPCRGRGERTTLLFGDRNLDGGRQPCYGARLLYSYVATQRQGAYRRRC